jgi:hypothetical protein
VSNLAVLSVKGIHSVAEGGQGLLAGTKCQGHSLEEKRGANRQGSRLKGQLGSTQSGCDTAMLSTEGGSLGGIVKSGSIHNC